MSLQIKDIELDRIKPYENNAKQHPKEQIENICKSIKEFGFNDPIAIDGKGVIIEGHGRYLAAQKMKMETVPCIILKHLSKEQKKAYILAHNKLNMDTGFDFEMLQKELQALSGSAFDFDFLGFGNVNLDADIDHLFAAEGTESKTKKKIKLVILCDDEEQYEQRKRKCEKAGWL